MTRVWYRPPYTVSSPGRPPTKIPLWYTQREADGAIVNYSPERRDTTKPIVSLEFDTLKDLVNSGVCVRVRDIGYTEPFDTDLDMDEGL